MKLPYLAFACLLLGCSDRTAVGVVRDGMTEQPIAGLRVVARAQEPTDMTCQVLEATTDDAGQFLMKKPCADIPYTLESGDKTIFLAGSPGFTGGVIPDDQLQVMAWRSPPGQGVYVLKGAEIFAMRAASKVSDLPLWKSTDRVRYPDTIPAKLPTIGADDHLILAGERNIKDLELFPLVRHEEKLRFGSKNYTIDMDPWSYIGRRFTTNADHESVDAGLDESKLTKIMEDKRPLQYIPGTALQTSTYALLAKGDKRVYLFKITR